jgi:hypothetical protein
MHAIRVVGRVVLWIVGADLVFWGVMSLVLGVGWSLGEITFDDQSRPRSLGDAFFAAHIIAFGSATIWLGRLCINRPRHELRLRLDPTAGTVTVALESALWAWIVRSVAEVNESGGSGDGERWELTLRLAGAALPASGLHELERFIGEVRARQSGGAFERESLVRA